MRVLVGSPGEWKRKEKLFPEMVSQALHWMELQLLILKEEARKKEEILLAGSSLHRGLDSSFALLVTRANIPLTAVIACNTQNLFWDEEEKKKFSTLLELAEETEVICKEHYEPGCIQTQAARLTDWLLEDNNPVLLLIRERKRRKIKRLGTLQANRVRRIEEAKGKIKTFTLGNIG